MRWCTIVWPIVWPVNISYRVSLRPTRSGRPLPVTNTGPTERQSPELLSSGRGHQTFGGFFDKSCDSLGLRHVDRMATLDLSDRRASPPGHETLGIRWNHLVACNDQVPLGLAFHAGSLILPLRASTPHGTWESAMNAAFSAFTSAAKEAVNFALSRNK